MTCEVENQREHTRKEKMIKTCRISNILVHRRVSLKYKIKLLLWSVDVLFCSKRSLHSLTWLANWQLTAKKADWGDKKAESQDYVGCFPCPRLGVGIYPDSLFKFIQITLQVKFTFIKKSLQAYTSFSIHISVKDASPISKENSQHLVDQLLSSLNKYFYKKRSNIRGYDSSQLALKCLSCTCLGLISS